MDAAFRLQCQGEWFAARFRTEAALVKLEQPGPVDYARIAPLAACRTVGLNPMALIFARILPLIRAEGWLAGDEQFPGR